MNRPLSEDTIAAVSTPPGSAGIAVIRLSGPEAIRIVSGRFQGAADLTTVPSHTAHHGWIVEEKEPVDEVVVTVFRAPASFTGEDVVELSCHGGTFISRRLLDLMVDSGARPAQPGEFSMRAFINGKMDLSQAEAVADLIEAKTEGSRRVAMNILRGRLSETLGNIRNRLIQVMASLEIELDFAEEEAGGMSREAIGVSLSEVRRSLHALLDTYDRGKGCRDGIQLVITGRPNVGKSSILNAIIDRERAIVTEIPGTTRDTVEACIELKGLLFTVTDTAGLRESADPVEREGVRRAEAALESADLVLLVFDGSEPFLTEDGDILRRLKKAKKEILAVINKTDLQMKFDPDELEAWDLTSEPLRVSALTRSGIPDLIEALQERIMSGGIPEAGEVVLTRVRHRDCLRKAEDAVHRAERALAQSMSPEFIALDVREALNALGELTGETTPDDILERIFRDFCIGK